MKNIVIITILKKKKNEKPTTDPPLHRCLRAQKKYEEALDFIHLSLSTAPPSAVSYIHLSSLLLVMRRYDEVLESSQASLRADRNPMVLNKDNPYLSLGIFFLLLLLSSLLPSL